MTPFRVMIVLLLASVGWMGFTSPATVGARGVLEGVDERARPGEEQRTMATELGSLADAWSDGGGTYGFPFWEKAGQRWRTGAMTTAMYREYVTGYRDRLVAGCSMLEQVKTTTEASSGVRELVLDACDRRLDGLRAQQRSLDERLRRTGRASEVELDAIDERIAELDAESGEAFQDSWRATRLAMDHAQAALDRARLERLDEDAFM